MSYRFADTLLSHFGFLFPSVVCNQIFIDSCQILILNPQVDLVVGLAVILSCLYDL